jgi:hypothetical protein
MISPMRTWSPSARFTPKYFGFESRRFLAVPPAFFVAMVGCYNDRVNIQDIGAKIKTALEDDRTFMAALLVSVAVASFGLGRLSTAPEGKGGEPEKRAVVQKPSIRTSTDIEASAAVKKAQPSSSASSPEATSAGYVASKNGTKYHLPGCSGAKNIAEENKVFFATKEEAEAAGYQPAANCPGL